MASYLPALLGRPRLSASALHSRAAFASAVLASNLLPLLWPASFCATHDLMKFTLGDVWMAVAPLVYGGWATPLLSGLGNTGFTFAIFATSLNADLPMSLRGSTTHTPNDKYCFHQVTR